MVPDNRLDRRWGYDLCRTKKKIIWHLKWDACVHLSAGAKVQSPQEVWGSLQQVALRVTHLLITFNVRTFNNVQTSLRKKRKRLQVILWIETQLLVLLNEPGSGRQCWAAQGPQGPANPFAEHPPIHRNIWRKVRWQEDNKLSQERRLNGRRWPRIMSNSLILSFFWQKRFTLAAINTKKLYSFIRNYYVCYLIVSVFTNTKY